MQMYLENSQLKCYKAHTFIFIMLIFKVLDSPTILHKYSKCHLWQTIQRCPVQAGKHFRFSEYNSLIEILSAAYM